MAKFENAGQREIAGTHEGFHADEYRSIRRRRRIDGPHRKGFGIGISEPGAEQVGGRRGAGFIDGDSTNDRSVARRSVEQQHRDRLVVGGKVSLGFGEVDFFEWLVDAGATKDRKSGFRVVLEHVIQRVEESDHLVRRHRIAEEQVRQRLLRKPLGESGGLRREIQRDAASLPLDFMEVGDHQAENGANGGHQ